MESFICPWETQFLFLSESVPSLLYYSHVPAASIALLVGIFVLIAGRKSILAQLLFALLSMFSLWSVIDLLLWSNNIPGLTMFLWSVQIYIELIIYALAILLTRCFLTNKSSSNRSLLTLFVLILPAIIFLPTNLYLTGIDSSCVVSENDFIIYYSYILEVFAILYITISGVIHAYKAKPGQRLQPFVFSIGIVLFLIAFTSGNIIGSSTGNWDLAQFGLFGMPIFICFLTFLIVQFKTFNIKLVGAQALMIILWALVGSLLFVAQSTTTKTVAGATLVFTTFAGYLLIRSVKKEVKQREELEVLTHKLEAANERLKELDKAKSEFVSIASHQLRSPLTSIRGYASMLAEGSFGQLPAKAAESAKRIEDSAKLMAMSIEDYLNVSRIESGNMKYNLSDFNLLEMTSKLCDDLRPEAMNRNLILLFRSDLKGKGLVNADVGKTNQIIHNLINNSIKYTPKGSVSVFVRDDIKAKRIYIDIIDTGIGMSKETTDKLFGKFSRANNANSVNTSGTGLGLYVALKMAEAMGGHITCTSEGDGKGSTFTFELPLAM